MIIPDRLWQPSPKDVQAQFAPVRVSRRVSLTQAAAVLSATVYTVPGDLVLIITAFVIQGAAGAGQSPVLVRLATVDTGGSTLATIASWGPGSSAGTGGVAGRLDGVWSGQAVCMPGELVQAEADFDAGVAANVLGVGFYGVILPRGNWQLG